MVQRHREGAVWPDGRGWSLRSYISLFMVVLLAVAAVAAFSVRVMFEQDARAAALADSNFAASRAAAQLKSGFDQINAVSIPLSQNPSVIPLFANPAQCTLGWAPLGAFTTGHIDLVRLDGSVACSSSKAASAGGALPYNSQVWLSATTPIVVAPVLDPVTGAQVVVMTYPIPGKGALVWFLDLVPIGPFLASEFGSGTHALEFLITNANDQAVIARSIDSAQSVGRKLTVPVGGSASSSTSPDLDGVSRIYGQAVTNAAGWRLHVGADEDAALSVADLSANRFLMIIVIGVAAMTLVVLVVYRHVAEPVRRLSLVMRSSKPGQLASAAVGAGAREVTDLAQDLDKLMARIDHELADRLAGEEKALASERNYRSLFESHPQPMWLYDIHTFQFLRVNDAAVERYGYSREEFLAMTIKDIRPPAEVPKFLELAGRPPAFDKSGPWTHLLKDGTTQQVLITSHAISFGEKEARFVLAEDLNESQQLELELHQSKARAEASAELGRAKDEMVSLVSHEMRTPLASIVGFTELLTTREVTAEQRKEYLSVMLQEGHRLTALINDFLDLRRIEGGHMTMSFAPADIGALIKRAVELFGDSGEARVTTRIAKGLPLVRSDSDAIFRVVANLLSNARKYSPNGGSVVVSAELADGMIQVSVQDEGLGIPADALSHLFQKFYRIDTADRRAIRGTGLGLAISKNIVEAHGGTITARSAGPGQGSNFSFTLPVGREQSHRGDVLVVEDDSGFARLLQAELGERDITSVWAMDAETAEQLMINNGARAVVLDLLLPGLSGEAFLQRLRERYGPSIPVVVITLKDLDLSENLALQKLGVTGVLRKGPGISVTAANLIQNALAGQLVAS